MYSISYPDIFSNTRVLLLRDHDASISNTKLLLNTFKGELFGDPQFGCNLKRYLHNQASTVLQDLVIDDIYTALIQYLPQYDVTRKDISVTFDDKCLYCTVNCINKLDNTKDSFQIKLLQDS